MPVNNLENILKVAEFYGLKKAYPLIAEAAERFSDFDDIEVTDWLIRYVLEDVDHEWMSLLALELSDIIGNEFLQCTKSSARKVDRIERVINRWLAALNGQGRFITSFVVEDCKSYAIACVTLELGLDPKKFPREDLFFRNWFSIDEFCLRSRQRLPVGVINHLTLETMETGGFLELGLSMYEMSADPPSTTEMMLLHTETFCKTLLDLGLFRLLLYVPESVFSISEVTFVLELTGVQGFAFSFVYSPNSGELHMNASLISLRTHFVREDLLYVYDLLKGIAAFVLFNVIERTCNKWEEPDQGSDQDTLESVDPEETAIVEGDESSSEGGKSRWIKSLTFRKAMGAFGRTGCKIQRGSKHPKIVKGHRTYTIGGSHITNERIVAGSCKEACVHLGIPLEDFLNAIK